MMKKLILFIITIALFSCKNDTPKNYATFSGKITNHNGGEGSLQSETTKKTIDISDSGVFSDTIHLSDKGTILYFSDGNEFTKVYLKNGDDIQLSLDTKQFDETVKFTGKGAANSNYLAQKSMLTEKNITADIFNLDKDQFVTKIEEIATLFTAKLAAAEGLDKSFIELEKEDIKMFKEGISKQFDSMKSENEQFAKFVGKPSPDFKDYENFKGGKTSLKDLRGKYVYVDVWATWCGPCKAEIPHLKTLEKDFHGKNITFLSISVDKEADKSKWKKMITDKKMGGVQLFADKSWKSDFVTGYKIKGIPRFILIDPKGNVVDANAPRPSSPKTKEILKELLK